jgi:SAM-dependent methyltransferase
VSGAEDHVARNTARWEATSDEYQERHRDFLRIDRPGWGVWQIPEDDVRVLGDVDGLDVLELGCGAAQWSIALAKRGARVTGLDVSARQLEHARRRMAEEGVDIPLVQASGDDTGLPDAAFDIVFCDHGATTFVDPRRVIPEAARLLRPGGLLAFCGNTPIVDICWPADEPEPSEALRVDYFGLHAIDDGEAVSFQLPYGEWVRLFAASGLVVADLIELRPPANAQSTYRSAEATAWSRRWPHEHIWKLRRASQ